MQLENCRAALLTIRFVTKVGCGGSGQFYMTFVCNMCLQNPLLDNYLSLRFTNQVRDLLDFFHFLMHCNKHQYSLLKSWLIVIREPISA